MAPERESLTPRECAKKLIRVYVTRGDSLESLRLSHMGRAGRDFSASIGGSCFNVTEEGEYELVKQFPTTKIGVTQFEGRRVCEIFPLKELYEEIQRENDPTIPKQITLVPDVPVTLTTPVERPQTKEKPTEAPVTQGRLWE